MNFATIREKAFRFLLPIVIIVVVLGTLIWSFGKAYLWDVSRVTVLVPEGEYQMRLQIQARIIYFDIDLFGYYYPFHIILPFSREIICDTQCVFDRIPYGDAVLTVFSGTRESVGLFIAPDTAGELDLRPPFHLTEVSEDIVTSFSIPLSDEQKEVLRPDLTQNIGGISIISFNDIYEIYDHESRQRIVTPLREKPLHIALGENDQYLFWTAGGVYSWDRYGRTPLTLKEDIEYGGFTLSWFEGNTVIQKNERKQIIAGCWSPLYIFEELSLTNGSRILLLSDR